MCVCVCENRLTDQKQDSVGAIQVPRSVLLFYFYNIRALLVSSLDPFDGGQARRGEAYFHRLI